MGELALRTSDSYVISRLRGHRPLNTNSRPLITWFLLETSRLAINTQGGHLGAHIRLCSTTNESPVAYLYYLPTLAILPVSAVAVCQKLFKSKRLSFWTFLG